MPVKTEIRDNLTGTWQIGLFEAPCKAPVSCCYGCLCTCCMVAQQRGEILDVIGEPYICCGGMFPCCGLGEPQDRSCAWVEACCCTGIALGANRFYIQTRFDRENTACDDCILWTTCLISWIVCILQMFLDIPQEIEACVDCMIMSVNGCMLAQQQVELDYVKKHGFRMNPQVLASMSPFQQQLIHQSGKPAQMQMMGGQAYAPGMPVAQAVPVGNAMAIGRQCENLDWGMLSPQEKQAAGMLGLTQWHWENDQDGPLASTPWQSLSPQQQQAALTLGITQQRWDSS
eukprot:TRINITY_DN3106_c0_g1_i1.p1 TRINITY_DN3106_c0_g1~~TRINITY_DN3106_c0_g1_i1.p1  ORF type:complete len:287 (+),score=47.95 TRINITY_DN3106_c0_g1_i1:124-984(+)